MEVLMSRIVCFALFFAFFAGIDVSAQVVNRKLGAQNFSGEIVVNQSAEAVWKVLTDMQKISKIMGYDYKGALQFSKPGDRTELTVWGDAGAYVLIYIKPAAELRYMWEPENASYLCQARWRLTAEGKTTRVKFEDRYTESGPQSQDDIAAQVKGYNEALARLKAICEGT